MQKSQIPNDIINKTGISITKEEEKKSRKIGKNNKKKVVSFPVEIKYKYNPISHKKIPNHISLHLYIYIHYNKKMRTGYDSHEKQNASICIRKKTFTDDNDDDDRANKKSKGHSSSL
jgi:hypothetical protein